jgi:outer membrane protein assembly factor BamB
VDAAPPIPKPRRLRVWPGVVLIVLQLGLITLPGWIAPASMFHIMSLFWGPTLIALGVIIWWLLFSGLSLFDRCFFLGAFIGCGVGAFFLCDPSLQQALQIYPLPVATSAWVLWLLVTPFLRWQVRRLGLAVVLVLAWGWYTLVRADGITGSFSAEFAWRWSPTAEQIFLLQHKAAAGAQDETVSLQPGDWPGFRGPQRDGRLAGVKIGTDWANHPPEPVWKHRVGPGWSSFAVIGHRIYTQEQRDNVESVVCYDADNGDELWAHDDQDRFTETVSGAGPRATPTFHEGKIYALGARGRLNCLNAATGRVIWSRDAAADTECPKVPTWGFASSPLVWHHLVTVYTGGPNGQAVIAYHIATGEPAWKSAEGNHGYCSPHPATLCGVEQILIPTNQGLTALDPTSGAVLWRHDYPFEEMPRCAQPALIDDKHVLLGTSLIVGDRSVQIGRDGDAWQDATEAWSTRAMKTYFNDRVIHKGHIYGFDGNMFTCLSLADQGKARWRGGRYGSGQVLLLADQDLLLIVSEMGDVVLVAADPEKHREIARFKAIEGKTWNHPVVAHGKLFVRNGVEAACFKLSVEGE